jgi:hypothetical protein
MVTHTWADLHIPEAAVLADLTGIRADLVRAKETANALAAILKSQKPDWSLVEPLSVAVAVAYSRPFLSGVRLSLKEGDLAVLTPFEREAHDHLRAFRDKHVAHSVNAFEHNQPRAQYCVERVETEGITGIGCSHGRVSGLSSDDVERVPGLCSTLLNHVDARIAAEQKRLLPIVRAMPLAEVLAGGRRAFDLLP